MGGFGAEILSWKEPGDRQSTDLKKELEAMGDRNDFC